MGKVARVSDVSARLTAETTARSTRPGVAFLAQLSPGIAVIDDNDHFFHSIGLAAEHSEKAIREQVDKIIDAIKKIGEPADIDAIAKKAGHH